MVGMKGNGDKIDQKKGDTEKGTPVPSIRESLDSKKDKGTEGPMAASDQDHGIPTGRVVPFSSFVQENGSEGPMESEEDETEKRLAHLEDKMTARMEKLVDAKMGVLIERLDELTAKLADKVTELEEYSEILEKSQDELMAKFEALEATIFDNSPKQLVARPEALESSQGEKES